MVIASDDNKEKLNEEEIEFVEDPANAGLFNDPPSSKKKRTRDDQPSPNNSVGPAKRGKPSGDELQMQNMFLAEQAQKQARVMQHRVEKIRQTKDVAIQCTRSPRTVEVAVQTDIPDIMEDLREQVKSLSKIVAELTEMKAREKIPSLPVLSDSDLTFINQDDDNFVEETPPQALPAAITSPVIVPEPQVPQPVSAPLSLHTYPQPQMRSPLSTIDRNSQVFFSSPSLGPSDQQKQKVEAIVVLGKEMISSAMARVDAMFSDEELANSNTSGSNRHKELDNLKLRFLMSVLRQKYESPVFMKKWEDVKSKINTRCRGKGRTVQRRLQKQVNF